MRLPLPPPFYILLTQIAEAAQGNSSESIEELRTRAEAGDVDAQYNLGVMYANDRGVPQDDAEAVAWYRKAAEQGEWNSGHTDIKVSEATVGPIFADCNFERFGRRE
jgi:hypothetical protein